MGRVVCEERGTPTTTNTLVLRNKRPVVCSKYAKLADSEEVQKMEYGYPANTTTVEIRQIAKLYSHSYDPRIPANFPLQPPIAYRREVLKYKKYRLDECEYKYIYALAGMEELVFEMLGVDYGA